MMPAPDHSADARVRVAAEPYAREETIGACPVSESVPADARPSLPDSWDEALTWNDGQGPNAAMLATAQAQSLSPREVMDCIRRAAFHWYDSGLESRYGLAELMCVGLDAVLQGWMRIAAHRNPKGMCYRIAWRMFRRLWREEFPDGFENWDGEIVDENGEVVCMDIGDAYGASGSEFAQPGSPDPVSAYIAAERERAEMEWWDGLLDKLPAAMASLAPTERRIVELYYGTDGGEGLSGPQIATILRLPVKTVYNRLNGAVDKLRQTLELAEEPGVRPEPERMAA